MKKEAGNHEMFSKLCMYCGQKLHYFSSRANVISMGSVWDRPFVSKLMLLYCRYKFVGVKPLPDEEALSKGANFLSEVFIFTVAGVAITLEVWRSEQQSLQKSLAAKAQEEEKNRILNLRFQEIIDVVDDIKDSLPPPSRVSLSLSGLCPLLFSLWPWQRKYERLKRIRSGGSLSREETDEWEDGVRDVATQHPPPPAAPSSGVTGRTSSWFFSWLQ
jgi:hypothetical protein